MPEKSVNITVEFIKNILQNEKKYTTKFDRHEMTM